MGATGFIVYYWAHGKIPPEPSATPMLRGLSLTPSAYSGAATETFHGKPFSAARDTDSGSAASFLNDPVFSLAAEFHDLGSYQNAVPTRDIPGRKASATSTVPQYEEDSSSSPTSRRLFRLGGETSM